ncbi:CTP-dependent riboflavin kinase [Candidatus Parvarchaeota archaeon]|nr:CTP-dependent riboflavin kinase [Candidatus Parvarchaeota archaeon]
MFDELLILLLKKRAHLEPVRLTTKEIATELGVSQQTASRMLLQLESQGFVKRSSSNISVSTDAYNRARKEFLSLQKVFDSELEFEFSGKVVSGLGEGARYIGMPEYAKRIKERVGFRPYAGTLNVRITPDEIEKRLRLKSKPGVEVGGFEKGGKTYGKLLCYRCRIGNIGGALVFPARSTHGLNTLEVIAPVDLRKRFGLNDGDWIEFRVLLG